MKKDWAKITTNAIVIVGLLLVIFELNQNHSLTRAQIQMDHYSNLNSHELALLGENPAAVLAKARNNHESLSAEERIIVNAHLTARIEQLSSLSMINHMGVTDEDWKNYIPFLVRTEFNYDYALNWWQDYSQTGRIWDEALISEMNSALN